MSTFFEKFLQTIERALMAHSSIGDCVYRDLIEPLSGEVEKAVTLQFSKSDWEDFGSPGTLRVTGQLVINCLSRSDDWSKQSDALFLAVHKVIHEAFYSSTTHIRLVETNHETKSSDSPVGGISMTYEVTFVVKQSDLTLK